MPGHTGGAVLLYYPLFCCVSKVAVEEACLGTLEELVECIKNADVLKPAQVAAEELLTVIAGKEKQQRFVHGTPQTHVLPSHRV